MNNRDFPHPHQGHARNRTRSAERYRENDRDRDRSYDRSRSRSQRRRSVARRPSQSRRRRRDDSMEDLNRKVERMYRDERSSTDSNFDDHSIFSRSDGGGGRYGGGRGGGVSPPTSVDDTEFYPRDRAKRYWRDARDDAAARPRHRSTRYQDADYYREPEYSYRSPRNRDSDRVRRFSPERRDRRPLPITYVHDDYPAGRAAEPRYLPPAAPVPPMMPRRNTDFFGGGDKRGEYFAGAGREFQDWRRQEDAFEAGMRAAERRQSGAYYV